MREKHTLQQISREGLCGKKNTGLTKFQKCAITLYQVSKLLVMFVLAVFTASFQPSGFDYCTVTVPFTNVISCDSVTRCSSTAELRLLASLGISNVSSLLPRMTCASGTSLWYCMYTLCVCVCVLSESYSFIEPARLTELSPAPGLGEGSISIDSSVLSGFAWCSRASLNYSVWVWTGWRIYIHYSVCGATLLLAAVHQPHPQPHPHSRTYLGQKSVSLKETRFQACTWTPTYIYNGRYG